MQFVDASFGPRTADRPGSGQIPEIVPQISGRYPVARDPEHPPLGIAAEYSERADDLLDVLVV